MPKLVTTFPKKVTALLLGIRQIRNALLNYPNKSPEFEREFAKLLEAEQGLQAAYDEALGHDSGKIKRRDKLRDEVISILKRLAKHVELAADGDVERLEASGFKVSQGKSSKISNSFLNLIPPALFLKHGPLPGTIIVRGKAVPGAMVYALQITDGDPSVPNNWREYGLHPHINRIEIGGLTAGLNYAVRVQVIGTSGTGAWSAPFSIMSL